MGRRPVVEPGRVRNVLTIDVEEYFHPSEVQTSVPMQAWSTLPSRVENETRLILDLLDQHNVKATFFILGWVAERYPTLVRRIWEAGHEIGCHSYAHQLVYDLTPATFRQDLMRAVRTIEDACGFSPHSYRAPSYSVTERSMWALEILVECGFTHDSSIFPISHDRYGIPGFGRHAQMITTPAGPIWEVPVATVQISEKTVTPVGGGGYLRLLPYRYTAAGIRRINEREGKPACIYLHPWELDPQQPRMTKGLISTLRTYTGLKGMYRKLERLLIDFEFAPLGVVHRHPAPEQTPTYATSI